MVNHDTHAISLAHLVKHRHPYLLLWQSASNIQSGGINLLLGRIYHYRDLYGSLLVVSLSFVDPPTRG